MTLLPPTLICGDSRDALKALPDNSLDSCVTDPPYALVSIVKRFGSPNAAPAKGNDAYMRASAGFMGKTWDTGETAMSVEFWAEVLRVLKPGAHLAAFGASRGYHRMACAIEDAGFEIRDSLMWVYGTGFPKSHDVSKGIDKAAGAERKIIGAYTVSNDIRGGNYKKCSATPLEVNITAPTTPEAIQWQGWGTALKPAFEPIVLARKPLSEKTVAANVLRWRTGALNIGDTRVGDEVLPEMRAGQAKIGTFERENMVTPERVGRWPANVVHSGEPEVIAAFPENTGANGGAGKFKQHAWMINETEQNIDRDKGSAARFFKSCPFDESERRFHYSAKASKADRAGSKHPTVKPVALMRWLARLITPPGGVVLDPFAGSGTTGEAAYREGFNAVLIEREPEYQADIRRRLAAFQPSYLD